MALEVSILDTDLEVVNILRSKDIEAALVGLVSHTVPHFGPDHHLQAVHVVTHDILQLWLKSLLVDQVEINMVLCADLNTDISLDVV